MVLCATISPLTRRVVPHVDESLHSRRFSRPRRPQADWSKLYILNIMDIKTTMECGEGIKVEIKYPPCIMDNDRVRLYGKLPANVHSIAKPTRFVLAHNSSRRGSGWSSSFPIFLAQVGQFADKVIGELLLRLELSRLSIQAHPVKLPQ
jgi:hypothetical protein